MLVEVSELIVDALLEGRVDGDVLLLARPGLRVHFTAAKPIAAAPDAPSRYGTSHARRLKPLSIGAPSISSLPYLVMKAWMISSWFLPWSISAASSPRISCDVAHASFRHSPMLACPQAPQVQTISRCSCFSKSVRA